MELQDWIGIYKGLRLPLLAVILIGITLYVYRPRSKKSMEEAKYRMLEDEFTPSVNHGEVKP